ncbi:Dbl-domain containing protein [Niveomyces insectorum RCEF 264]|uniref:Dbl-domain containing protein n=1 Tax=Niveomyces insectorum RCEF 264 TaxID=1081102 RepID=A0A167PTE7_9HYPO|nr:Dbl-domain containing protein [Niveomyces insectorum RCEF 264]
MADHSSSTQTFTDWRREQESKPDAKSVPDELHKTRNTQLLFGEVQTQEFRKAPSTEKRPLFGEVLAGEAGGLGYSIAEACHQIEKTQQLRQSSILKLIATEKSFVCEIDDLVAVSQALRSAGVTQDDLDIVFRNLGELASAHRAFIQLIQNLPASSNQFNKDVRRVFRKAMPAIEAAHKTYYQGSRQALRRLHQIQCMPIEDRLALQNRLVKPDRRLTFYPVLIDQLPDAYERLPGRKSLLSLHNALQMMIKEVHSFTPVEQDRPEKGEPRDGASPVDNVGLFETTEASRARLARRYKEEDSVLQERTLSELVQTEESFVRDMVSLLATHKRATSARIKQSDLDVVFRNVDELALVHESFLGLIKVIPASSSDFDEAIRRAFLSSMTDMKAAHKRYCQGSKQANNRLCHMQDTVTSWPTECIPLRSSNQLTLDAYLIKPVQQLPRYPLLIDRLLQFCEGSDALRRLSQELKEIVQEINDAIPLDHNPLETRRGGLKRFRSVNKPW